MHDPTGTSPGGFRLPADVEGEVSHIIVGEWHDFGGPYDIETVLDAWSAYIRSCLARIHTADQYTRRLLDLQGSLNQAREDALAEAWRSQIALKRIAPGPAKQLADEISRIGPPPSGATEAPKLLPAITDVPLLEAIQLVLVAKGEPDAPSEILKALTEAGRKDSAEDLSAALQSGKGSGVLLTEPDPPVAGSKLKWAVKPRD